MPAPRGGLQARGRPGLHRRRRLLRGPAVHARRGRGAALLHAGGLAVRDHNNRRRGRGGQPLLRRDDLRGVGRSGGALLRVPRGDGDLRVEHRLLPRHGVHHGPLRARHGDVLRARQHERVQRRRAVLQRAALRHSARGDAVLHHGGQRVSIERRLLRRDAVRRRPLRVQEPRSELQSRPRLLHGPLRGGALRGAVISARRGCRGASGRAPARRRSSAGGSRRRR